MWKGEHVLAVIPCRTGSKRIPRKNFQVVAGRSLIERAVDFAHSLDVVDDVFISTDSVEVRDMFPEHVLVTRDGYLHSDDCTGFEVWRHAWDLTSRTDDYPIPYSIYLEPSSPLRQPEDVLACLEALDRSRHAATVSLTPKKFCPEKTITGIDGALTRLTSARQSRNYYHLNGVCYASRSIYEIDNFYAECRGIVTDHVTVNIDDPIDLELADYFLKLREQ